MSELTVKEIVTRKYVLELDEDEAMALYTILRSVGGCPDNSPRRHADKVYNLLDKELYEADCFACSGRIIFNDFPEKQQNT